MHRALKMTAALLGAVIFFLLITLPARPRPVPEADARLAHRTVAGAYHVHTTRSDGAGDRAAVAAAAARTGLKFVIFTDHGDGTRVPDPPAYLGGVLCIDAVEVSTNGGHYVALGLGAAPYPLGGEPAAVIEDVTRLGGFGFAAHPDSVRPELAWSDWSAPFDGVEWLNADSEWRNETRPRLARVLFDYLFRPAAALASVLDRPVSTLARWDAAASRRRVTTIAGHDAHGGAGRSAEYRGSRQSSSWAPGIPSYAASFGSFSTRVVLPDALTGSAAADAEAVLSAVRSGSMFTAIDATAQPAAIDFHAARPGQVIGMGALAPPGAAAFAVAAPVPEGARTVLLRDGREVARAEGGTLRMDDPAAEGSYRVEVQLPGAPGDPPVPWILTNPIFFLNAAPPAHGPSPGEAVPLPADTSWHVEKDRGSSGSVVVSAEEVAFYYRLRGPSRVSQFAAAVAELRGSPSGSAVIRFRGTAVRPVRISVQLRYRRGGGERWVRSVYLDATPRDIVVPIGEMRPADHQAGPPPPTSGAQSLLFVADMTNSDPGSANTIRISDVGFGAGQ